MTAGLTPELASRGGADDVMDEVLPMLAAQWLIDGWDSAQLRDLAAMSRKEAREGARRQLAAVLASLGFDLRPVATFPWEELPWRGYWALIVWARDEMDRRLSPYAAAQRVLEVVGDVPGALGTRARRGAHVDAAGVGCPAGCGGTPWTTASVPCCDHSRRTWCRLC